MCHCFRKDHTVAFVKRRQDERVSRSVGFGDPVRRALAGENDAAAKTERPNQAADGPRCRRIAFERANAMEAPLQIANAGDGSDKKLVAFARDEVRDTEQLAHWWPPWLQRAGRPCRSRRDHRDPLNRYAVACDGGGGFAARTEDTADLREQFGFMGSGGLCRDWRK